MPDAVLGAQRKRRKIRIGDIGNDQAEGERSAPDEALRDTVGPVAEPGDDVLNPLTRLSACRALARQDMGDGADRDVRRAGHVANRDALPRLMHRSNHAVADLPAKDLWR